MSKCHFVSVVPQKDILKYLQKCEECTHFCDTLYIYIYIYIYMRMRIYEWMCVWEKEIETDREKEYTTTSPKLYYVTHAQFNNELPVNKLSLEIKLVTQDGICRLDWMCRCDLHIGLTVRRKRFVRLVILLNIMQDHVWRCRLTN